MRSVADGLESIRSLARQQRWPDALHTFEASRHGHKELVLFNALLSALEKSAQWQRALLLVSDLERPSVVTFNTAMSACGRAERWQHAMLLSERLFTQRLRADVITSSSLITACAAHWAYAVRLIGLWDIAPSVVTFNAAMNACGKGFEWQQALVLLQDLRAEELQADVITFNSLISACAKSSEWQLAACFFSEAAKEVVPSIITYNSVLDACKQAGLWQLALSLLEASMHLTATVVTFSTALSACQSQWPTALRVLRRCLASTRCSTFVFNAAMALSPECLALKADLGARGLKPDLITHHALLASATWPEAETLLTEARALQLEPSSASYAVCPPWPWPRALHLEEAARVSVITSLRTEWPRALRLRQDLMTSNAALSACEKAAEWQQALLLFYELLESKVADVISFNTAMSACEKAEEWRNALWLLQLLEESGLRMSLVSFSACVSACEKAAKWQHALHLLQKAQRHVELDLIIFNAAIVACEQARRWRQALALLVAAEASGLQPNEVSYGSASRRSFSDSLLILSYFITFSYLISFHFISFIIFLQSFDSLRSFEVLVCCAACGAWRALQALLPWAFTPLAVSAALLLGPRPPLLAQLQRRALAKLAAKE